MTDMESQGMVNISLTEDKKSIEEEEKEKKHEFDEKQLSEEKRALKEIKEGMEVKPKKIPIGGIQMPGFFTRSKSKEQCKDDDQAEGTELIEQQNDVKEDVSSQTRVKLPNPFKKTKPSDIEEVSVFQKMKKNPDPQTINNQNTQAGLASVETLDEKSNNSTTDGKGAARDEKKEPENDDNDVHWTQRAKTYKIAIGALLSFLILIIIIVTLAMRGKFPIVSPPITNGKFVETITSCGKVEGQMEDSSFAFRGIPYARQPIGELRFKYAQPLNKLGYCWNDTFLAHNATPTCLQILGNGTVTGIEDCLTLDIVTPYIRYDNPLPVIVLIGADSLVGGSPGKMRPSARYARSRDVVFVRPNFRLGALGFLSLDILSQSDYPHTSGNYGLSDILEALRWIQLNIEHFGGDKNSVTLFGHKAGATLVTALSTIPQAKKYFSRAWASSGGANYPQKSRAESEADFKVFLESVGCQDAACLQEIDAEKLVTSVPDTWRKPQPDLPSKDENPKEKHQWLVVDGNILRENPEEVWSKGSLPVKLVIGSTAHAGSSDKLLLKHTNWTESLVRHHVKESHLGLQNLTDEVLKMYSPTYQGLSAAVTDVRIACPLFAIWTKMQDTAFYMVNQTRGVNELADIESDIDAILGRYEPKTPEQRRYFSAMQGLFYHFVWHDKIEEKQTSKQVIIVDQDALHNSTYSHCAYWMSKNIVPLFAALD
ncbi:neurotactin isoform X2 [Rhynchophorus ferrugineus]|uniref:neurotactin isoform X2 n=1 Tax=Rhynchophorus ferrugineus TaxID=354439 RepID=UPI003FCE22A8